MRIRIGTAALAALAALTVVAASCSNHAEADHPLAPAAAGRDAAPAGPPVRISEIHYDNDGVDAGERIELSAPAGTSLAGYSLVLYNGSGGAPYATTPLAGVVPATAQCGDRGVVTVAYPPNGIQNGSPDGVALVGPGAAVIEFLSYEGTFTAVGGPADGRVSVDLGVSEPATAPLTASLQRTGTGVWQYTTQHSFDLCNDADGDSVVVPPSRRTIAFSGREARGPALPVGFQDQLFATERDGSVAVPTTFVWSSETPAVAVVDQLGVITALAAGTAVFRATAADGTTATYALPTRVAVAGATARYANNTEFGVPTDADASDDYLVANERLASSYNRRRGTPNWVSYNLEATHFGAEDRCDCFTFDPRLPADFPRYTTADYTGASAAAGYGIDRGHLARSFDRTTGSLDNAETFYFTNIVPQAADQNQGPWAALESYLGGRATRDDREVFIVAGVAGSKGTLKGEGRVTIPASTWKVAVTLPRDRGLADVDDADDLEVVAVVMPNDPGVRNVPWERYRVTVDSVEALSGYDLLDLLPDRVEAAVEGGPGAPPEIVGLRAFPEGQALFPIGAKSCHGREQLCIKYTIGALGGAMPPFRTTVNWGDGSPTYLANTVPAANVPLLAFHTYAAPGRYTVTVRAEDRRGASSTGTITVSIVP